MNNILMNAYQNELTFMKQKINKWKKITKKAVKERNNLQSKIDKINQYIKKAKESDSFTVLPSGKKSDVGYCLDALEDIEDILKEEI